MHCGFTKAHYKEIIENLKDKGYSIKRIMDFKKEKGKQIYLRHDIDFNLEMAHEMANLEYDLGVRSSYFVYLHSETYNALSPNSMGMIRSIYDMGHEIGLHTEGTNFIQDENKILEYIFKGRLFNYAFHLPGLRNRLETFKYLRNVQELPIKYISDSGRNWREGCLCKHKEDKLHVLIHPEWYMTDGETREDAVHKLWVAQEYKTARDIQEIKAMLVEYVKGLKK